MPPVPLGTYGRAAVVLALAGVAGFVDGVGYLLILGIYTSHMTGNTAALGRELDFRHWCAALEHGWPIAAFLLGLIAGAAVTEAARRRRFHGRLAIVLGLEALLLFLLLVLLPGVDPPAAWLGLPAFAMGMQTVTITRVGDQRVYSTYITGSLAKFAEALASYFFWLADRRHVPRTSSERVNWLRECLGHRLLGHALLTAGLWLLFLLGGLAGAAAEVRWQTQAFWWPLAALAALALLDLRHPIAPVGADEPPGFEN